ncbi:MAG: ATP-binding protein [Lentisphaeria bacterium]|nr:ATP-binding protein [Lentisphaeria bacterium]
MRSYDFAELVHRKVESDELDYKSAMSWRTMTRQEKGKILRHLTAFANTKGGYLVIGVSEDASGVPCNCTGVSEEEASSFDPTPVGDFINSHIEPPLDYTIERPTVNGKRFVIFVVRPFKTLPHVCSRGVEGELQEGIFYIRTAEASSRAARRAHEMQELLRRCMRNEREQLGRILRGILYETRSTPQTGNDYSSDLILDAERYFRNRRGRENHPLLFKFSITPEEPFFSDREELLEMMQKALFPCSQPEFLSKDEAVSGKKTPGSYRYLAQDKPMLWQFFDNGLFCYFKYPAEEDLSMERFARFCAEAVTFAGNLGEFAGWSEELLTLKISLVPSRDIMIDGRYRGSAGKEISAEITRSAADLNSGRENHASRLLRRVGELLRLPDSKLDSFRQEIRNFLERR